MKKVLLSFALLLGLSGSVWAYDFSAVSPSGQTLYFYILSNGTSVSVVWPNASATTASDTWDGYTKPSGALIIPNFVTYGGQTYTVKGIGTAFYQCTALTSVVIADSVTGISINAFRGCTGLTSLVLGSSLRSIGDYTFMGCTGLTSLTIPHSITNIGKNAFSECTELTTVFFNADSCILAGVELSYDSEDVYPYFYFYPPFENCNNLTTAIFGNNVKKIPSGLFHSCTSLTTINIPDSIKIIGNSAFRYCSGLSGSITLPEGLTVLENDAFNGCSNLVGDITIPSTLYYLGKYAFCNCTGLTSLHFNAVQTVLGYPEWNDRPSGYYYYGWPPFWGCSQLNTLYVGSSVQDIFDYVFFNHSFTEITFMGATPPVIRDSTFMFEPENVLINIPCGSLTQYQAVLPRFNNINEYFYSFSSISENENKGVVHVLSMPTCTAPNAELYASANSGYHFDHWSTGSTSNPYTLTVTSDTVITAYFVSEGGTEGIEDVGEQSSEFSVYAIDGKIVVEGAEGETVRVYDVMGRMVTCSSGTYAPALTGTPSNLEGEFRVPTSGVYLVKVGQHPAHKVVVIR